MLLEVSMQIFHELSPLKRRFRDIQIVIIANFVVLTSVGVMRIDCILVFKFIVIIVVNAFVSCRL